MRTYPFITGPAEGHAHQGVRSPKQYLAVQAREVARVRAAGLDDAVPHAATARERAEASVPHINHGQWKLRCACGNAPSVSVEWDLACCFECGAIYRDLAFPPNRSAIEAVLLKRPRQARNWTDETVAQLAAENRAHGDEVPDGL